MRRWSNPKAVWAFVVERGRLLSRADGSLVHMPSRKAARLYRKDFPVIGGHRIASLVKVYMKFEEAGAKAEEVK